MMRGMGRRNGTSGERNGEEEWDKWGGGMGRVGRRNGTSGKRKKVLLFELVEHLLGLWG